MQTAWGGVIGASEASVFNIALSVCLYNYMYVMDLHMIFAFGTNDPLPTLWQIHSLAPNILYGVL